MIIQSLADNTSHRYQNIVCIAANLIDGIYLFACGTIETQKHIPIPITRASKLALSASKKRFPAKPSIQIKKQRPLKIITWRAANWRASIQTSKRVITEFSASGCAPADRAEIHSWEKQNRAAKGREQSDNNSWLFLETVRGVEASTERLLPSRSRPGRVSECAWAGRVTAKAAWVRTHCTLHPRHFPTTHY